MTGIIDQRMKNFLVSLISRNKNACCQLSVGEKSALVPVVRKNFVSVESFIGKNVMV